MPSDARKFLRPELLTTIGSLEFRARAVVEGFVSGMHRSPYQGYSVEFAQHREYVPGDDLRHLDWRVYGKSDRFFIKQYEEETNLRCQLLLDCSTSMRYPEHPVEAGRMNKFDYAATVAASLAYLLVQQQDAVGLTLFDHEVRVNTPALSNIGHLRSVIGRMEEARLEQPTQTGSVLESIAGQLPPRTVAVLLSDLLADEATVISALRRLRHGNREVIVMHVLDHDEREFPFQDNTLFEGLEVAGLELYADPQSMRQAYLESLSAYLSTVRKACTNARIDYVGLSTTDPLDVALRGYLAARAHRIKARV